MRTQLLLSFQAASRTVLYWHQHLHPSANKLGWEQVMEGRKAGVAIWDVLLYSSVSQDGISKPIKGHRGSAWLPWDNNKETFGVNETIISWISTFSGWVFTLFQCQDLNDIHFYSLFIRSSLGFIYLCICWSGECLMFSVLLGNTSYINTCIHVSGIFFPWLYNQQELCTQHYRASLHGSHSHLYFF